MVEEYGFVEWGNIPQSQTSGPSTRDLWLKLENGPNILRVVTKAASYKHHNYKEDKDEPGFGDKIKCSSAHGSCPLCERGDRAKTRYIVGVISRPSNHYKILDITHNVAQSIKDFVEDPELGETKGYDINIKVNRKGGPSNYYNLIPRMLSPLSEEDMQTVNDIDLDAIKRLVTPPSPEDVLKGMQAARERKGRKNETSDTSESLGASDDSSNNESAYQFKAAH